MTSPTPFGVGTLIKGQDPTEKRPAEVVEIVV